MYKTQHAETDGLVITAYAYGLHGSVMERMTVVTIPMKIPRIVPIEPVMDPNFVVVMANVLI